MRTIDRLTCCLLPVVLIGCGNFSDKPDDVIKDYAKRVDAGDKAGATALMSAAGKDAVAAMDQMTHETTLRAANELDHIEITSEKIDGDRATVQAVIHNKTGPTRPTTFHCVKENGKWGVSSGY